MGIAIAESTRDPEEAEIVAAARILGAFAGQDLSGKIGMLERAVVSRDRVDLPATLTRESIGSDLLWAAYLFKRTAGQINVTIHAVGILRCLPALLDTDETVLSLSLGAGNTGRKFDLETDRRVAEFKFIHWKGGAEVIRQNALFKDFYGLVEDPTPKRKYLYVIDADRPIRFLRGRRSLSSVMSRNRKLWDEFRGMYGDRFHTVGDYYAAKVSEVTIVDVSPHVPELLSSRASIPPERKRLPRARELRSVGGAITYSATRLLFRADVVESLGAAERFRVETPMGAFEMTYADFRRVFANVVESMSYRDRGVYHYAQTPQKALQFLRS